MALRTSPLAALAVAGIALTVALAGCGDDPRRPGRGSDGGITLDGGDDGPPPECGTDVVSPVRDAYCSSSTGTCIDACDTGDCIFDCLDADPNPDCSTCVNINIISCANSNGCQGDWDAYTCCLEGECGQDAGTTCIDMAIDGVCGGDSDRYNECVGTVELADACPNVIADCF